MTQVRALESGPVQDSHLIKKLSARDRMRVIQAYRDQSSYRVLASQFNCSVEEIKTIHFKGKQRIFGKYIRKKSKEYLGVKRISPETDYRFAIFLEEILYEWFQRAQRRPENGVITNELILAKAKEAERILPMKNFNIDLAWVLRFRQKYNITDLDMTMLVIKDGDESLDVDMGEIAVHFLDQHVSSEHSSLEILSDSNDSDIEFVDQNSSDNGPTMTNEFGQHATLSMRDRVRVIQAYKNQPSCSILARQFNCSEIEIRNIHRRGRQRVIMEFVKKETKNYLGIKHVNSESDVLVADFLEKMVYEWFQRAQRFPANGKITNSLILTKALEAKRILPMKNFNTNLDWVLRFREKYEITELEMTMLKLKDDDQPTDLDMHEIAVYIVDQHLMAAQVCSEQNDIEFPQCNVNEQICETFPPPEQNFESTRDSLNTRNEDNQANVEPEVPSIENDEEAQRHLKPLEDYALIKENHRAIGVLTQLREILSATNKDEG